MGLTVFLDRDGVINRDSPLYIKSPDEFHFIPGAPEAIALLTDHGCDVILITNQSAIGRKMITLKTLDAIFAKLKLGVEKAGGSIKDIFFCPHTSDAGCDCRKPLPGLILNAIACHGINPVKSVMVGDSAKDIQCGLAAGCPRNILVATGNGKVAARELEKQGISPDFFGKALHDAAQWIIANLTSP